MKLLEKKDLKGIDSTSETIKKWDAFFKKGLVNLGYRDELIENMYPYDRGIPMIKGERLPVDQITGRRFFKMSDADKLAGMLMSCIYTSNSPNVFDIFSRRVMFLLLNMWEDQGIFDTFFPDLLTEKRKLYSAVCMANREIRASGLSWLSFIRSNEEIKYLWKYFIDNCDIFQSNVAVIGHNSGGTDLQEGWLTPEEKEEYFLNTAGSGGYQMYKTFFIFYKPLEESFGKLDFTSVKSSMILESERHFPDNSIETRLSRYSEVYLQDYLCVSLNPIDKFMCSTKQAFGSCMSIAKQNDTQGTNSAPAFGLPAMFDTDGVFMLFMTPGKHKNMYWETSEWEKDGVDRDKEKAYKYLKMTCRSLTYQGRLDSQNVKYLNAIKNRIDEFSIEDKDKEELLNIIENLCPEKERLYVGRQYCLGSAEDNLWQIFISVALARFGVRTSMAFANDVLKLRAFLRDKIGVASSNLLTQMCRDTGRGSNNIVPNKFLLEGAMEDDKVPVAIDRYGYLRGFYYDNLSIPRTELAAAHAYTGNDRARYFSRLGRKPLEYRGPITTGNESHIRIGSSRQGSGSICSYSNRSELDMFKILIGKQDYTYYNNNVKTCTKCKKILSPSEESNIMYYSDGSAVRICNECVEKSEISKCPSCGELYDKDNSSMHEIFNVREITHPRQYRSMEPVYVCKKQLTSATYSGHSSKFLCAHCGTIHERGYYFTGSTNYIEIDFHGINVVTSFCKDCYKKATMCDKCKKVIFMDTLKDACLLLPNRRVVCPDCIDSIRMQKEKREQLKKIVSELTTTDIIPVDEPPAPEGDIEQALMNKIGDIDNKQTLIKDVHKQINSYLKAHPEREFPVIKESDVSSSEEVTNEVVDEPAPRVELPY